MRPGALSSVQYLMEEFTGKASTGPSRDGGMGGRLTQPPAGPALTPEPDLPCSESAPEQDAFLAWAGADSVAWKIHSEVALLLGWGRAILLQFAHPAVAAGVADHSLFLARPWGRLRRLHRTLDAMVALTFGSSEERLRATCEINAVHHRVRGRVRDPAGIAPAGRSYSARDPALLLWVHATLLDSFLRTYESYVGPLTPREKDRYCDEMRGIGVLLGIPRAAMPEDMAALQSYLNGMLASGEITVTDTARALARQIVSPPAPPAARPLLWLLHLPTIGLLPPQVREGYGYRWDARREAALRCSAGMVRLLLRAIPTPVRQWPAARAAFRRAGRGGLPTPASRHVSPRNMGRRCRGRDVR